MPANPKTQKSKPYLPWLTEQPCVACGQPPVEGVRQVVCSHKGGSTTIAGSDDEAVALCIDCDSIERRAPEPFWQSVTLITKRNRQAHVDELRARWSGNGKKGR